MKSVETTQTYLHAHLALKEAALAKLKPYERGKRTRFQPNDRLLAFLECAVGGQTMPNGRLLPSPKTTAAAHQRRETTAPFGIVRRAA